MKTIILIGGHARSGKNTFGNFLEEEFKKHNISVQQDSFASEVKKWCQEDFKYFIEYINNYVEKIKSQIGVIITVNKNTNIEVNSFIENLLNQLKTKDENWFENKTPITRILLQTYGTEIFRKRVNNNWWANQLKERFIKSNNEITIVTDVRFPNEIEIFNEVDKYNVITINIKRNVFIDDPKITKHDSEIALDNWNEWSYIIDNNSTLEELKNASIIVVNDILKEFF